VSLLRHAALRHGHRFGGVTQLLVKGLLGLDDTVGNGRSDSAE
jgi:hypothetical protein